MRARDESNNTMTVAAPTEQRGRSQQHRQGKDNAHSIHFSGAVMKARAPRSQQQKRGVPVRRILPFLIYY
jgi:hypothetical protein